MGGLFSGPPRLPPSNPQGEDFGASPLVTDRFDLASAESATPLPPPSPPRAPLIPVADEALTRRPGRQSTVLSLASDGPLSVRPNGNGDSELRQRSTVEVNPTTNSSPLSREQGPAIGTPVLANLRGLRDGAYLDSQFVPMIEAFDRYARDAGVELQYSSGYRTPAASGPHSSSGTGTTPAQNSLHSAGWAVDVQYRGLPADQQKIIRDAAAKAGLSWGGNLDSRTSIIFISIRTPVAD